MTLIDMHAHWSTRRGYPLQTEAELAMQRDVWKSEPQFTSEQEMADHFRSEGVKVILDLSFEQFRPVEVAAELHDYAFGVHRAHPDVVLGQWLHVNPRDNASLGELRRCISEAPGFVGLAVSGSRMAVTAADPLYEPFYRLCIEANIPALILVGYSGLGATMPGGDGIVIDHCHPRHLDLVAARYPDLKIVAGRPAWPWQTEMLAIMLHKPNVVCELHGWSPKYFTDDLKAEIRRRLSDRMMFGSDYPFLGYAQLRAAWRKEEYPENVLEAVLHGNAERYLAQFVPGLMPS